VFVLFLFLSFLLLRSKNRRRFSPLSLAQHPPLPSSLSPKHNPPRKKTTQFSKLSGGISNIILKVALAPQAAARAAAAAGPACAPTRKGDYQPLSGPFAESVAVKVFGDKTELVVDRAAESSAVAALAEAGFGPQVMATFCNGRAERFLHCHTLRPEQMTGPPYRARIAAALARFHAVRPPAPHDPSRPALWPSVRRWLDEAKALDWSPEAVPDARKREGAARLDFAALERDVARIRAACELTRSPVVFAHNDLLSGNILVLQRPGRGDGEEGEQGGGEKKEGEEEKEGKQEEEGGERGEGASAGAGGGNANDANANKRGGEDEAGPLTFIDFEYGAYNPRGFDLANHFNEYAGFECDYGRYPHGDAAKAEFLRAYLAAAREAGLFGSSNAAAAGKDDGGGGGGDDEEQQQKSLSRLCAEVDVFSLASHAYWGVWSIIQARHSPIDFDYMSYHYLRWAELRARLYAFCARAEREFGGGNVEEEEKEGAGAVAPVAAAAGGAPAPPLT
jgi:ethanolamine kinase